MPILEPIATLALLLTTQKSQPELNTNQPTFLTTTTNKPDFDTQILRPLQAAQAEQARKEAEAEAERLKQAQIAYESDLQETAGKLQPFGTYGNNYSYGNCTLYVASRISVPNSMGNAKNWGWGLLSNGWRNGEARGGAIGVTQAGWAGHVVVAEGVNADGTVNISEMNYFGLGVISYRTVYPTEFSWYF